MLESTWRRKRRPSHTANLDQQNLQNIGPRTKDSCRSYGVFDPQSVMWRSSTRQRLQPLHCLNERHITGIATKWIFCCPQQKIQSASPRMAVAMDWLER